MENWSFLAYEGRFKIIKCTTRQCGVEVLPPEIFFPIQVLYLQFWLLDKQLYVFCPQNQIYRRIYPFLVQAGSHKILLEVSIILIRETYFIPSFSRRGTNFQTSIFVFLFHLQSIQIRAFRNTQTSFGQKYSSTQHLPTFTARPQDPGVKVYCLIFNPFTPIQMLDLCHTCRKDKSC